MKSDTERQLSYNISYMWNLKKKVQMNLFTKQKLNHKCRRQTYGFQVWGRITWEIETDMYTLLYTKQKTNKILLYSTGHFIQYSVMTCTGIESKKE